MGAHKSRIRKCTSSSEEKNDQLFKIMRNTSRQRNRKEETRDLLIKIEQLLKDGADPKAQDCSGKIPLHYVAMYWNEDFDNIMNGPVTDAGSPGLNENGKRRSRFGEKSRVETRDFIQQYILATCDVNVRDKSGKASLHYAAMRGKAEIVRMLLLAGADPNSVDNARNTPLILAVENIKLSNADCLDVARQLINAGANVDAAKNGTTALHLACQHGNEEMIDLLLSHGASVSVVDKNGYSALLYAVKFNIVETVRKLIDAGADVNLIYHMVDIARKETTPRTALHIAIMNDNLDMLECLLKSGADPNLMNKMGKSILLFASDMKPSEKTLRRIKLLVTYGADMYDAGLGQLKSPFQLLISPRCIDEMRVLLELGLDISRYSPQKSSDFSPLHELFHSARFYAHPDPMLSLLLEFDSKGSWNLEHVDVYGRTPLCLAAASGWPNSVKLLIDHGANVDHIDSEGRSPLDHAFYGFRRDDNICRCLQLLVEAGANLRNSLRRILRDASVDRMWDQDDVVARADWNRARMNIEWTKCIIKHRILYESQRAVAEPIERVLEISPSMKPLRYSKDCRSEIDLLKNCLLFNSIAYYEVLTNKNLYERIRDDRVYEAFDEEDTKDRFPVYAQDLIESFKRVKNMHETWETAVEKLSEHLGLDHGTYYFIIQKILQRLHKNDLQAVAES